MVPLWLLNWRVVGLDAPRFRLLFWENWRGMMMMMMVMMMMMKNLDSNLGSEFELVHPEKMHQADQTLLAVDAEVAVYPPDTV